MVRGQPDDCFERNVAVTATIESEDELFKVSVDVFQAQAMIGSQRPALHQREGSVDPGQYEVRCHAPDDSRVVDVAAKVAIRPVTIGYHHAPGSNVLPDERLQHGGRVVWDSRQPNTTGACVGEPMSGLLWGAACRCRDR